MTMHTPLSHKGRQWVWAVGLACLSCLPLGFGRDWHVAAGAREGDGSVARPFGSVQEALQAARSAVGPHRILVQSGDYYNVSLTLGPQDAGLSIEGTGATPPVLYGGIRLTNWQAEGRFQVAPLPSSPTGRPWEIRLLLVNGEARPRARYPSTGALPHESVFSVPWMSTTGGGWQRPPTDEELTTLKYRQGDVGDWLEVANAEITVFHMWDESCVGIAAHDVTQRILKLTPKTGHPPGAFGVQKYVLWNIEQGMLSAGNWYHDRARNRLVYWPKPGEKMANLHVVAPNQTTIISLRGERDKLVRGVVLRRLTLAATTVPLISGGFAAEAFPGAIQLQHVEQCRLDELIVRGVAGHGIKGNGITREVRVENCEVTDCGAGGVYVGGERSVIFNNHIHGIGRAYPSAIGIYRGGRQCRVAHNEVHDCSYSAINYGGTSNIVENNLLYDCMKVLHDGAAIYMFAASNCVLRGNLARDIVDTGGYGASAYYLDERSSGCLVESNLSIRVNWPSHNHMATNNTIRHNLFMVLGDAKITFPRSTGFILERNLLYATGKIRVEGAQAVMTWSNNLFFAESGRYEWVTLNQYSARASSTNPPPGVATNRPLLLNLWQPTARPAPESPAHALGIGPVDVSQAGRLPRRGK
ncbi:MAG: right-handed parallel beta-helix repeat-containing protein [Verrucomicrobiae bacterium]|nr:right-handed parallel beta-helix repeat-containing protein [Verrucomicrobiae bacterium]